MSVGIDVLIWTVKVDTYFITGGILSKISCILFYYPIHAKIIKRSGGGRKQKQKQNTSKNQLSSFITTNCSQNMSAARKISAASKSFDIIKAGEMCQSLSFLPDGGVCYFHIWLLMDKQASLPGKQGSKLRKQTNKSNHALDMEASDRYD